jgi:hypothetical protein
LATPSSCLRAFFLAFLRRRRSLSTCRARFISSLDSPGLAIWSSYRTHHQRRCTSQAKEKSTRLLNKQLSCYFSVLCQRTCFLTCHSNLSWLV